MPLGSRKGSHGAHARHAQPQNVRPATYHTQSPASPSNVQPVGAKSQPSARRANPQPSGQYAPGSYKVPEYSNVQAQRAQRAGGSHAAAPSVAPVSASQYSRSAYGSAARKADKKRGPWKVVFIVSIVILVISLCVLAAIGYQYWSQDRAYDDLEQYANVSDADSGNLALSDLTVDWATLKATNPDIVAWIYVPGTPINYPVVQGDDNEEYLHKAFDGSTGWLASAGTIFLDAQNANDFSDRNSALYGHHMNNGSMFASLADFVDQGTFDEHRDIYVLTPKGNYRLKTFAVVKTTGSDAIVQTSFANESSYQAYVQDKLDRSVVSQSDLTAASINQSMLFSTCEYTQNDGRSVLFAAVVETTVANDPYVSSTAGGTTNLSSEEDAEMDREYKEAA